MDASIVEGLCLRRVETGEHDAVVTFLTPTLGKVACIAKGVTRPRSHNGPACWMFVLSRIQLTPGRALPVLTQADIIDSFYGLREDLWRSAYATYLCELTDRALPDHEPVPAAWALLLTTLHGLLEAAEPEVLVRSCELRLLAALGYQPVLDRCARCDERIDEQTAIFSPAAGGLVHLDDHDPRDWGVEVTPRVVKSLRRLLEPERYGLDLGRTRIPPELAAALREAVRGHLRFYLEGEPKSAAFLDRLRETDPSGGLSA